MNKEERIALKQRRKAEWRLELARLERRQQQKREHTSARAKHNTEVAQEIWRFVHGEEFACWYEATTGDSHDEWLAGIEHLQQRSYATRTAFKFLDWLRIEVEKIVAKNQWTNPEARAYWSAEVLSASTPRERRVALMRLATPRWADREKILAIYAERRRLVVATGVEHDVDHVVPIVSRFVCGLHVEYNLRIVTATENRKKSNSFIS